MMKLKELLASTIVPAVPADDRGRKIGIFLLWLALVVWLSWNHAFWRDEVRALSIALQGSDFVDMLRGLHGEGHPAVWYLLLRAAHFLLDSSIALPIAALVVACAAFLLLVLRAPFSWPLIGLILLSKFAVFEYSVMARNYGISVLLMFSFAACYKAHRDRGLLLGSLLFLLANTNAHSVLLVGSFLLLWLVDVVSEHGTRWSKAHTNYAVNASIAVAGILTCLATIYPTYNDAASSDAALTPAHLAAALLTAVTFEQTVLGGHWQGYVFESLNYVVSLAMVGALLGLLRSPGAFIAGLAALLGLSLLFVSVYSGQYRHQALWLAFLISLYWIVWDKPVSPRRDVDRSHVALASVIGSVLFVGLLSLQLPGGLKRIANTAIEPLPFSRSRDFGELVAQQPELEHAIVIADPDFLVEPLPYYVPNRTYLMREQRFGRVVRFTRGAQLSMSLDDILSTARRLRAENNTSVLILLMARLDPDEPAYVRRQGYNWELVVTPEQTRKFLSSVRQIASFGPAESEESFDVYILENPCIRQVGATLEENTPARNSAAPDPLGESECSTRK